MIKLTKIAALSSSLVIFSGLTAHAFLLPPGPVTPTVDAPTDVTFSLENVGATAQMYAAQAQTYANNMTKAAKSAKKKYMDKFTGFMGGLFKKKEKQAIPGSKTIQESKIADIYDAESVKRLYIRCSWLIRSIAKKMPTALPPVWLIRKKPKNFIRIRLLKFILRCVCLSRKCLIWRFRLNR